MDYPFRVSVKLDVSRAKVYQIHLRSLVVVIIMKIGMNWLEDHSAPKSNLRTVAGGENGNLILDGQRRNGCRDRGSRKGFSSFGLLLMVKLTLFGFSRVAGD